MSTAAAPYTCGAAEVANGLGSDRVTGLGPAEARRRQEADGPNELPSGPGVRPGEVLVEQVTSPILLLLIGAGVLSAALGDIAESLAILAIVVLDVLIGFRQELRAERAMASLQAMATSTVKVVRGGATLEIPSREVVAGDLALLEAGGHVPADGRLGEANGLRIDESSLTGESAPVDKQTGPVASAAPLAERASMAYSGTSVVAGRGTLVVTATGIRTELGHIAELLQGADPGRTPLQQRLDTLVRRLGLLAGAIVVLVFALGLLRGEELGVLLLTAVSLAVAAIPESLPVVVTITLALGAQRMLTRNALIRRLYAVETLGSVTTICSDKTGTLTQNRMTVTTLDVAGTTRTVSVVASPQDLHEQPTLALLLLGGALCNDTAVTEDGDLLGDPTETALVTVAKAHGLKKAAVDRTLPRLFELPFDSERKRMTTGHRIPTTSGDVPVELRLALGGAAELPLVTFTKGAVDGLAARCSHISVNGERVAFDPELRRRALEAADASAAQGVRVLAVAMRRWAQRPDDDALEDGLTFLGLQGMVDPARPEAADAIATCAEAGVRAIMITGDHPLTAAAIGRDLGLVAEGARVITGTELEALDTDQLERTVREVSVYARVAPEHKLRIVEALQRLGQVVAMTGDGVNDAPALKQADIGVAMGVTGTDVTKDAADVVLLDDDFATIVSAVGEGRVVFDNVRKFIRYILSCNLAEVLVMVLGPLFGMPIPLLPLQILWLNLVTDGLPAMALAVEPPEPGVMRRPPTPLGESLLGADRGRLILTRGAALAVLVLLPTYLLWDAGNDAWQTVLFTSLAFAELSGAFAMRSDDLSLRRLGPLTNRPLVAAVTLTVALQAALIAVAPLRDLLGLTSLDLAEWGLVVAIALAFAAVVETEKLLRRHAAPR